MEEKEKFNRTLGPVLLWGLGVGYVISGMYFGWNLGLPIGGTLGLGIATIVIILLYVCFSFSYTELACMIPKAGGAFDYAREALGDKWAYLVGTAQLIEFLFAPPAIAAAIGAYFSLFFPGTDPIWISIAAFLIFTLLNIVGVKSAASFELGITILAVCELLLFAGLTLPHFSWEKFSGNPLPGGWSGAFAALPFAVWFFLAIEGVANVAEETRDPQKNILIGFGSALGTLIFLCGLVFISTIGVGGWEMVVYPSSGAPPSDYPLPLALRKIYGEAGWAFHLLITIGLFGLVASFHGIILAGGRATFELGRAGFLPGFLGRIQSKFNTPTNALIANAVFGIAVLFRKETSELITISAFGALLLYLGSMISFFVLRIRQPHRERPFLVPGKFWMPSIALVLSGLVLTVTAWQHPRLFGIFILILATGTIWARKILFPKR